MHPPITVEVEQQQGRVSVYERNPCHVAGEDAPGWHRGTLFDDPDDSSLIVAVAHTPTGNGTEYGSVTARFAHFVQAVDWILTVSRGRWVGAYNLDMAV